MKHKQLRSSGKSTQNKKKFMRNTLEIVFTRAAPAFDNLFMGCVFNINTVHKTVEKLTFQAFYRSSQLSLNLLKKE